MCKGVRRLSDGFMQGRGLFPWFTASAVGESARVFRMHISAYDWCYEVLAMILKD